MMIKDSIYAAGSGIKYLRYPTRVSKVDMNPNTFTALECFNEAEMLTTTTISILLGCSRRASQKLLQQMWGAQLIKCIEVSTSIKPKRIFKLWISGKSKSLPRTANDACRVVALSAFYARMKDILPGFRWKLIRQNRGKKIYAQMLYNTLGGQTEIKLLIDAPRRGEKPNPNADIYIFPTVEEAKLQTPNGKRYTADYIVMNNNISFENIISDPVNAAN